MKTIFRFLLHLFVSTAILGAELRFQNVEFGNGTLTVSYPANTNCYYILFQGTDLEEIYTPRSLKLGQNPIDQISDPATNSLQGYFRLQEIPQSQPGDLDNDGIDDVYEARHPEFLDPLRPSDANQDFDNDGKSNREEYNDFEDPTKATASSPTSSESTIFSVPIALAGTGQTDMLGRPLTGMTYPPSINDKGYVVFSGRVRAPDNVEKDNLFSIALSNRELRPLMATNRELTSVGDYQLFKAPHVNNQNMAVAWRRTPQILTLGDGSKLQPVFSYIEKWPVAETGLGVRVENGDLGTHRNQFVLVVGDPTWYTNPQQWDIVHGRFNASSPAINNFGQTAYCTQNGSGVNFLATDAAHSPANALSLPDRPRRPKLADNGMVVAQMGDVGAVQSVRIFSHDLKKSVDLVSTTAGFSEIGPSVNCNDDGSVVTFYGNLRTASPGLTSGIGVFACVRTSRNTTNGVGDTWQLVRIAGVSGNGQLDPGETNLATNGSVQDQGNFSNFETYQQTGVGNQKRVAFLAVSTNGTQVLCASQITINGTEISVGSPTVVATKGMSIVGRDGVATGETIQSISLHDPINNSTSPAITFQADSASGKNYAMVSQELMSVRSRDRLVCVRLNKTRLEQLAAGPAKVIIQNPDGSGTDVPTNYAIDINDEDSTFLYQGIDGLFDESQPQMDHPSLARKREVVVAETDPITGDAILKICMLAHSYGQATILVSPLMSPDTLASTSRALTRDSGFSDLIDTVNEHINSREAASAYAPNHDALSTKTIHYATKCALLFMEVPSDILLVGRGGIDGFWSGAKGDAEGIWQLLSSPVQSVKAIGQMFNQLRKVKLVEIPGFVSNMWREFLEGVDNRVEWLGLQGNQLSRQAYISGYMVGFGGEQWLVGTVTAGLGRAVLGVMESARVGQRIGTAVSIAKKGVNTLRYRISNHLERFAELAPFERLLHEELGAISFGGSVGGELVVSRYANVLTEQTRDFIERRIASYGAGIGPVTSARIIRSLGEIANAFTERGVRGLTELSSAVPKRAGAVFDTGVIVHDQLFERLLTYCTDATGALNKTELNSFLELLADGPGFRFAKLGDTAFRSPEGLVYGFDNIHGNRLLHVLHHSRSRVVGRRPVHSEFLMSREQIFRLLDNAWAQIKANPSPFEIGRRGTRIEYRVEFSPLVTGKAGERAIFLIVDNQFGINNLITAYPYF